MKDKMAQIIGAILLALAFCLAIADKVFVAILTLVVVGLFDLVLIYKKQATISEFIRSLAPWNIDRIILVGLVPFCLLHCGAKVALWFTLGLLNAHFFNIQNSRR